MATGRGDGRVALPQRQVEDWEDWECDDEDDVLTLIDVNEPLPAYGIKMAEGDANMLRTKQIASPDCGPQRGPVGASNLFASIGAGASSVAIKQSQKLTVPTGSQAQSSRRSIKHLSTRASKNVIGRISRPLSKKRQKPVQSKLRLITDMSAFKRGNQSSKKPSPVVRPAKFVDLAALAALEGDPTPASFGNWGWLRKTIMQSPRELSPRQTAPGQNLSPDDRPIMIGITLPHEEAASRGTRYQIGDLNPHLATGPQIQRKPLPEGALRSSMVGQLDNVSDVNEPKSVWSPDTPDTACSFASLRPASSVYSQMTMPGNALGLTAPPVPAVPANFRSTTQQKPVNPRLDLLRTTGTEDENENSSPHAPFEEDGAPVTRGSLRGKLAVPTPSTANSASLGWWDHHLVTPFLDRTMSMSSRIQKGTPSVSDKDSRFARRSSLGTESHLEAREQGHGSSLLGLGIGADNGLLITFGPEDLSNTPKAKRPVKQETQTTSDEAETGHGVPDATVAWRTVAWNSPTANEQPSRNLVPTSQRVLSPPGPASLTSSGRSTPTLRVPTPRRTPSPAVSAPPCAEAPYESLARHAPAASRKTDMQGDKPGPSAGEQRSADIPPPYSPPKKQAAGALSYQAVFPPDHAKIGHGQPKIKGAPGLASTLTSQGTGRKLTTASDKRPAEKSTQDIALLISMTNRPVPQHVLSEEDDQPETDASTQQSRAVKAAHGPLQSHFSLSPDTVITSHTLDDDLGSMERRLMSAQNPPMPFLTRLDVAVSDDRFQQDVEGMPRNPARAHLAHEPAAPSAFAKSLGVRPELGADGYSAPLPVRPTGTYLPEEHSRPADGPDNRIERQRRRHEKEDVTARRVGGFWRGRGCIPANGCFGRSGREGRKKRRMWMGIIAVMIALVILAVVLGNTLARHHAPAEVHSIWVNLTDFPPMPTGVLTFVGPDNTVSRSGCTEPSTLWSCSLPKDDQDSSSAYKANQPTIIFQIQWDNSTGKGWDTPTGRSQDPPQVRGMIDGFQPNPNPPSFEEMWFLGETTDNVTSSQKAGEPAPFFISVLNMVNETVTPPNEVNRRSAVVLERGVMPNATTAAGLPRPALDADGSPKGAVMIPRPVQQPVRLYDRGLPTEHYAFYTYFDRSIFLKSVTVLNQTQEAVGLDQDGGCRKTEANFFVTWAQTRMLVQIWTRQLAQNTSSLLPPRPPTQQQAGQGQGQQQQGQPQLIRPGTMPYPVTVTMDTHGGDPGEKFVWDWPMNERQQLQLDKPDLLANNMAVGGSWINPRANGNATYGGFDGGSGGCKCQWVNFA